MKKQKNLEIEIKKMKETQEKTNELLEKLVLIEEERNKKEEEKKEKKTWKDMREDDEKERVSKLRNLFGEKILKWASRNVRYFIILMLIIGWYFSISGQRPIDLWKPKTDTVTVEIQSIKKDVSNMKEIISNQNVIIQNQSQLIQQKTTVIQELQKKLNEIDKQVVKTTK